MNLSKALPFAAVTFTVAGIASMGLPGFSGFVAELQVLVGAWHAFPTLAVLGGFGILVGVAYTLRAMQLAFYPDHQTGSIDSPHSPASHAELTPISVPERLGALMLIGTSLVIGLFPRLLLDFIVPSLNTPLFDGLRKVCAP